MIKTSALQAESEGSSNTSDEISKIMQYEKNCY